MRTGNPWGLASQQLEDINHRPPEPPPDMVNLNVQLTLQFLDGDCINVGSPQFMSDNPSAIKEEITRFAREACALVNTRFAQRHARREGAITASE